MQMKGVQNKFTVNKVLLVDNDTTDIFINNRILMTYNFSKVIEVKTSAEEALEYLHSSLEDDLPEIIFLDVNMPSMDGFEFLTEFEKLNERVKMICRIVMLANHLNEAQIVRLSANRHVMKYFFKPLELESVVQLSSEQYHTPMDFRSFAKSFWNLSQ